MQSQIHLFRIPVTDEQAPLAKTIDQLVDISVSNYKDTFVFNCQIGRGRTTTGMIICCMALAFKRGEWHSKNNKMQLEETSTSAMNKAIAGDKTSRLLNGFYGAVSELVRMMQSGMRAKRKLDYIIDHNSEMQNIREVIYHYHVCIERNRYKFEITCRFEHLSRRPPPKRRKNLLRVLLTSFTAIVCCLC